MSSTQQFFSYNGYFGSTEISHEDQCFVGQILYIDDLIMYEGETYEELKEAFQRSVDDYLEFCKQVGKEPEKTYSGSFNIRIGAELHNKAARAAMRAGVSLNDYVKQAITKSFEEIHASDLIFNAPSDFHYYLASAKTITRKPSIPDSLIWSSATAPDSVHEEASSPSQSQKVKFMIVDVHKSNEINTVEDPKRKVA